MAEELANLIPVAMVMGWRFLCLWLCQCLRKDLAGCWLVLC